MGPLSTEQYENTNRKRRRDGMVKNMKIKAKEQTDQERTRRKYKAKPRQDVMDTRRTVPSAGTQTTNERRTTARQQSTSQLHSVSGQEKTPGHSAEFNDENMKIKATTTRSA